MRSIFATCITVTLACFMLGCGARDASQNGEPKPITFEEAYAAAKAEVEADQKRDSGGTLQGQDGAESCPDESDAGMMIGVATGVATRDEAAVATPGVCST